MVLSPHKNLRVIIGGTRYTSHVLISLTLICLDCFILFLTTIAIHVYSSVMPVYAH